MTTYSEFLLSKTQILDKVGDIWDADFGYTLKTQRLGLHYQVLPPGNRSSYPHAESLEEEFVFVVHGTPHVWINGYIYLLKPGMCVGFPAGTGIAHCFLNNSHSDVHVIVLGERTKKENRCSFPVNPEFFEERRSIWWADFPPQEFGPHDGTIGNLQHLRSSEEIAFIKDLVDLPRSSGFTYPDDIETFTAGVRLSDHLGLKALGIWHDRLEPGKRTSWPHCHSLEEEAAIVLKGSGKVWMNGFVYDVKPGDCVFFKPGTGIAHTIINDSDSDLEFLGIGEALCESDKIHYPLHELRNERCRLKGRLWLDAPADMPGLATERSSTGLGIPLARNLEIRKHQGAKAFLEVAEPLLMNNEAEYSLMLGLATRQLPVEPTQDSFLYFSLHQNGVLVGATTMTGVALVMTKLSESNVFALAKHLHDTNVEFPACVGPENTSDALSKIWSYFTSKPRRLSMAQRILQLDQVIPAKFCGGEMIFAHPEHADLAGQWMVEFLTEALPAEITTLSAAIVKMQALIESKSLFLWLDKSGTPVAMNFTTRPTKNGISVACVYTPPKFRGHGFASNLVAQTSQRMLDSGRKFCTLYTDASNPTSNKIYEQIGYREIATSRMFRFSES